MIDHFRQYLVDHPGDRFAMYSLALALKRSGDCQAHAAFQELLALHPHSGAGWYQYGELLRQGGELEAAQRAWSQGLSALATGSGAEVRRSISEIQSALDELEDEL